MATMRRLDLFRKALSRRVGDNLESRRWRSSADAREAILETWSDQLAGFPDPPEPAVVLLSPDRDLLQRALESSRGEVIVAGGDVVHVGRAGVEGLTGEAFSAPSEPRRQFRTLKEVCGSLGLGDAVVIWREKRGEEVASRLRRRLGWVAVRGTELGDSPLPKLFPLVSVIVRAGSDSAGRVTIESLMKSSWPNLEIIAVVAAAEPPSGWLEELVSSQSGRLRIFLDTGGPGRLEGGASLASGEFLLFVGVPLLASPAMVSALAGLLHEDEAGIVGASLRRMQGKENRQLLEVIDSLEGRSGTIVRRASGVLAIRNRRWQSALADRPSPVRHPDIATAGGRFLDHAFRSAASCEAAALQLAPRFIRADLAE
jgi:hypothetical protein